MGLNGTGGLSQLEGDWSDRRLRNVCDPSPSARCSERKAPHRSAPAATAVGLSLIFHLVPSKSSVVGLISDLR